MKQLRASISGAIMILLSAALAAACGKGSPTSPSNPGGGGGGGGTGGGGSVQTTTITINASGQVTPNDITISAGSRVTFINNHNRSHEMNSDPHPEHSNCPAINDVGFIAAGQTKLTGNLNTVRTCGFHDHNEPGNTALTGQIRIQ